VVEILTASPRSDQRVSQLKAMLEGHDDWAFRVFWAPPATADKNLEAQRPSAVIQRIAEVRDLISTGHLDAALLLCWATFEAVGRIVAPAQFERPQPPARLVQVLAQEGHLTPSEADRLRHLAELRNAFIHGDLGIAVSAQDLETFIDVLETLLHQPA